MNNPLTETLLCEFKPVLLISVYKTEDRRYYLESHDMNDKGEVLAGKPLQQETIQEIVDVFFDERKANSDIKGLVPDNLLSYKSFKGGNYKLVWYRPAEIRVIHHAPTLKLPTNKAWVPAIVYHVERDSLSVYALPNDNRPKENNRLYKAPFFNVNDDGDVCLGNARVQKPKEKTYDNIMKYWEDMFWLSEFSHVNGSEKVKSKDLNSVWKRLLTSKTKIKWADIKELIPYKDYNLQKII